MCSLVMGHYSLDGTKMLNGLENGLTNGRSKFLWKASILPHCFSSTQIRKANDTVVEERSAVGWIKDVRMPLTRSKNLLISAPVLETPNFSKPFILISEQVLWALVLFWCKKMKRNRSTSKLLFIQVQGKPTKLLYEWEEASTTAIGLAMLWLLCDSCSIPISDLYWS